MNKASYTHEDRTMLIEAATNIRWIKETMEGHSADIKEQRKELDSVKKKLYMATGAMAAFQLFINVPSIGNILKLIRGH